MINDQLKADIARAKPYLERALERFPGEWSFDDVVGEVIAGKKQLWLGENYAGITEVVNYPQGRELFIHLVGGEMEEVLSRCPKLVVFAEMVGAQRITFIGRRGWSKVLAEYGYKEKAVHFSKEV